MALRPVSKVLWDLVMFHYRHSRRRKNADWYQLCISVGGGRLALGPREQVTMEKLRFFRNFSFYEHRRRWYMIHA